MNYFHLWSGALATIGHNDTTHPNVKSDLYHTLPTKLPFLWSNLVLCWIWYLMHRWCQLFKWLIYDIAHHFWNIFVNHFQSVFQHAQNQSNFKLINSDENPQKLQQIINTWLVSKYTMDFWHNWQILLKWSKEITFQGLLKV